MPLLLHVTKSNYYKGKNSEYEYLKIFGDDYDKRDGTCIRDFIHIVDLANAHVLCLDKFKLGINIINIGTGTGTTLMELINTFKNNLNIDIPYKILERRNGNVMESYCNNDKAVKELEWNSQKNINDICSDS
jgi:UDP-glucose 4-epimerase